MAGYSDTRQLIIDTLMGRPAGTEIQPEDHQAFALQITDYIRSVELVAGNATPIGFADASTVPVQPDNRQAVYLSSVGGAQTVTFSNFIDQNGNAISVTSTENVIKLVTLLWNGQYWSSQVTSVNAVRDTTNGYLFMGTATPETNPETPDQKIFYIATTAGTYQNFDSSIILTEGELAIIKYNESGWSKETVLSIIKEKDTVFFNQDKNLFDINDPDVLLDKYFNYGGDIDSYNNYLITGYIPFTQEMNELTASVNGSTFSNSAVSANLYDENKQRIAVINETISKVTWQSGVSFVRFTIANYNGGNIQIEVGDSVTEYVPYGFKLKEEYLSIDDEPIMGSDSLVRSGGVAQKIQKISEDVASILRIREFHKSTIPQSYISYSTKQPTFDASSFRTDYISTEGFDKVVGVGGFYSTGYVIAFYDSEYNLIENGSIRGNVSSQEDTLKMFVYDIPQDAHYVIMSQYNVPSLGGDQYLMLVNSKVQRNYLYEILKNKEDVASILRIREFHKSTIPQSYISYSTKQPTFDASSFRTDYISTEGFDKVVGVGGFYSTGYVIAFYDSEYNLIENGSIRGNVSSQEDTLKMFVYDIPQDAHYVIMSQYNVPSLGGDQYLMLVNSKVQRNYLYEILKNKEDNIDLLETLDQNPLKQIKKECGFAALFTDWGFIGDSLSSATFNTRDGGITDYDYSWPQYICRLCGTSGYNFTIPGATSKTWLENTTQRGWTGCQANPKKSYIIALGCNDADSSAYYSLPVGDINTDVDFEDYRNNSVSTFAGNYAKIIQSLKTISPQAKVFCVTLPQGDRALANSYNAIIRELTQRFNNVFLIDLWTYAKPVNGVWAQRYREGYHLNTQGNIYTAYEIMTYIDWLVRSNPSSFKDIELIGTNNQMSGQYKVSGTITNGENAFISITNDSIKAYISADDTGNYSYLWLSAGTYDIYVQKQGREIYRDTLIITNSDVEKNIVL